MKPAFIKHSFIRDSSVVRCWGLGRQLTILGPYYFHLNFDATTDSLWVYQSKFKN